MLLIGQYDSPFVRRVAIALHHYALPFEHKPWSVWRDADEIARYNPLRRVPTLLLDDGTVLVETFAILDALDELVAPERTLIASSGLARRANLRVCALASGVADKAVTLLYASLDLVKPSEQWTQRCRAQILETLALLETERAAHGMPYWFGAALSHADIALSCGYRFTTEAHPDLIDPSTFPALSAQAARCEALSEFRSVYLPLTNNLKQT